MVQLTSEVGGSMKYFILLLLFANCSSFNSVQKMSSDEKIEYYTKLLSQMRPLLSSDDFHYMKCKSLGHVELEKNATYNDELWNYIGDLDLRVLSQEKEANIISLKSQQFGNVVKREAEAFNCKEYRDAKEVDDAGMCSSSEERLFVIKYNPQELRQLGEVIIKTKIKYYALEKYYKSYNIRDIKYSFTKKEYSAKAKFFKCF